MTLIEEAKAQVLSIKGGRYTSSTIHEFADLVHRLLDDIEGNHDQAEQSGAGQGEGPIVGAIAEIPAKK
jgi:hypothetical protein